MASLIMLLKIAKVALGLGFVIFIHELGHFIMAKWNGVKVEKFSIGFGPTIFGWKRGETEYVLAWIPLGGFVKMLGEGPEEEENRTTDPRAYPNKSVGARMAIISAGVIMNVILGLLCSAFFFSQPRQEVPAVIGSVAAGSPAYLAGLEPGDEIMAIDGHRDPGFMRLLQRVMLSSEGAILHLEVKHPGKSQLSVVDVQPRREGDSDRPTMGVSQGRGLLVGLYQPLAGMASPPRYPLPRLSDEERRDLADFLVAAGPRGESPTPLADFEEYQRILTAHPESEIVHIFERKPYDKTSATPAPSRFELVLPPCHFVDLGIRLSMEPVLAVRRDSVAEKAGLRAGDHIKKVNGRDDFDPMRLPEMCYKAAGQSMTLEIERPIPGAEPRTLTITLKPAASPPRSIYVMKNEPVDIPALGFCYRVRPRISGIAPGSPAAEAGLKPGELITSATVVYAPGANVYTLREKETEPEKKTTPPATFDLENDSASWFAVLSALQEEPGARLQLVVNRASKPVELSPVVDPTWPNYDRGLAFGPIVRDVPGLAFFPALRAGFDETLDSIAVTYATVRSLVARRVGPKNVGGPIAIAQMAFQAAGSGIADLVMFLGMLSINLAVINFLPVPPLDGGQMVFLIAEKIKGKPLPDSAINVGMWIGLILVLCLMVFVTYQDILRLLKLA